MLERQLRHLASQLSAIRGIQERQSRILQRQQATAAKLQRPRQPATTEEVGILLCRSASIPPLEGFPLDLVQQIQRLAAFIQPATQPLP